MIYRIVDGRGTGKTSRLMLLAKENDALFVCSNPDAMRYKAKAYGLEGIEFISYGEFFHSYRGQKDVKYVIDELENFLKATIFYSTELIGYTLSLE